MSSGVGMEGTSAAEDNKDNVVEVDVALPESSAAEATSDQLSRGDVVDAPREEKHVTSIASESTNVELPATSDGATATGSETQNPGVSDAASDEDDNSSPDPEDDVDDEIVRERLERFATGKDFYCWQCHKDRANLSCSACPRSYHRKCLPANYLFEGQLGSKKSLVTAAFAASWVCPECKQIREGEERRRTALSAVSDDDFNQLLISALGTVKSYAESLFYYPVSDTDFPEYKQFIFHPMDFQAIDRNVRKGVYKSTDGFLADVKWIVHNCYIYNSPSHVLTKNANYFFKVTKTEMAELEVCPDCFMNYYTRNKTFFIETCKAPHRLVWARLKGHPFWPAKLVRIDASKKEGDCRFFGDKHDRAWVPFDSIFLLSEHYPWTKSKSHKSKLDAALGEVRIHIEKLSERFPGVFRYADPKTPFNFANACLTSDDLMTESTSSLSSTSALNVTEGNVTQQLSARSKEEQKRQKQGEIITQNKDEDEGEEMLLDDEERPLIIDAPAVTTSSNKRKTKSSSSFSPTNTSGAFKRRLSDSGKNKAINSTGIPVKKKCSGNNSTLGTASTSSTGKGSATEATSASNKAILVQKSKIPTKKAISTASTESSGSSRAIASSKASSSNTKLTNCPQVTSLRTAAGATAKRKDLTSSQGAKSTTQGVRKARIVNTGVKSSTDGSPAKRTKTIDARNETSLLTQSGDNLKGKDVSGANNKTSSRIGSNKSTHTANGSLQSAPSSLSSLTIHASSDVEIGSTDNTRQQYASSPDILLPNSSGKNCSNNNTKGSSPSSNSTPEVKLLKDEIKRLKEQVHKLRIEMKEMREATEVQISAKVSLEKEKALSELESRLNKSFSSQLEDTKKKQWCAQCLKEAIYFCCWNTSYCGYECQSKHWPSHMSGCQQNSKTQSSAPPAATSTSSSTTTSNMGASVTTSSVKQSSGSFNQSVSIASDRKKT